MSENKKITSSHTNNSKFNFNYSSSSETSPQKQEPTLKDLLILDDVKISPINKDAALVVNLRTGKMIVLASAMANLVQNCDTFKTSEQHLQTIKKLFKLSDQISNELKNVIASMNEHGLMLSAETFKTRLLQDYTPIKNAPERNWVLGVGSCDRPKLLKRMLDSALPYLQEYSPKPEFIFVDDSRNKQNQQENFLLIKSFCEMLDIDIHYWDRSSRAEFANNLADKHPEYSESIRWLLDPEMHGEDAASYGLGKNFIQLYTRHKPLIMLDDDCIISPINRLDNKQNIRLHEEENRFFSFTKMEALLETTNNMDVNPFREHLQQLNTSVIESISAIEKSLDNASIWHKLERNTVLKFSNKSCVGMTTNRIAGAQNSRYMDVFFTYPKSASNLEAFLKSVHNETEINQIIWRGPENNNISKHLPFICTTMSGLSASKLPTPTIPIGRNEDLFLGELKSYLAPIEQCLQFNWALPHCPEPERTWNPQQAQIQARVTIDASTILRHILVKCNESCPYENKTERLDFFAFRIDQLIDGSEESLKKYINDVAITYLTSEIFKLENIAKQVKHYTLYLNGVRNLLESRKQELMQILNSGGADIMAEFIQLVTPMGDALRQWPEIVELAQDHLKRKMTKSMFV